MDHRGVSRYRGGMTWSSAAVQVTAPGYSVCHLASREYGSDRLMVRPLTEAWPLPFHDDAPVRALPSYKGQKNFTGLLWSATNSRHVGYESWLERDRLTSLDRGPAGQRRTEITSQLGPTAHY